MKCSWMLASVLATYGSFVAPAWAQVEPQALPVSYLDDTTVASRPVSGGIPVEQATDLPAYFRDSAAKRSIDLPASYWMDDQAAAIEPSVDTHAEIGCDSWIGCDDGCCESLSDSCCEPTRRVRLLDRIMDPGYASNSPTSPYMLGNSLSVPRGLIIPGGSTLWLPEHFTSVGDNNTVRPTTRTGVAFQWLKNIPEATEFGSDAHLRDVDAYVYRLTTEMKFLGGNGSVMLHVPFNTTIQSDQTNPVNYGTDFGDLSFGPKFLVVNRANLAISTGAMFDAPTSPERMIGGTAAITNSGWHISPFVGVETNRGRAFSQTFVSYRGMTRPEQVVAATFELETQDLFVVNSQFGYWIRRGENRLVSGISPTLELHYISTVEGENPNTLTSFYFGRTDQLTLTGAMNFEINNRSMLSLGYGVPLRDNPTAGGLSTDRMFDGELTINFNMYGLGLNSR